MPGTHQCLFPSHFICPVRYMHSPFMSYKVNIFLPSFWLQSQGCLNECFGIKIDASFDQPASYYLSTIFLSRLFTAYLTKQIHHVVFLLGSTSYFLFHPAILSYISVKGLCAMFFWQYGICKFGLKSSPVTPNERDCTALCKHRV